MGVVMGQALAKGQLLLMLSIVMPLLILALKAVGLFPECKNGHGALNAAHI